MDDLTSLESLPTVVASLKGMVATPSYIFLSSSFEKPSL
jgi:hypothetical protein